MQFVLLRWTGRNALLLMPQKLEEKKRITVYGQDEKKMSFMIDRTCQKAAFLLGTALMLGTGLVTSDVLNVYATEAVDPAAAAQPTDPAATTDPNAAAQPAVDPAVAQPMDPNAVTQPADPNAAADPNATTDTTTTTQPAAPKKQTVVLTEQLKKDIENSHAPGRPWGPDWRRRPGR